MYVVIKIVQDVSSPTEKIWGYFAPENVPDTQIFYGPTTKPGGSVYSKPRSFAEKQLSKKIRSGYDTTLFDGAVYLEPPTLPLGVKDMAVKVFRSAQMGQLQNMLDSMRLKKPAQEPSGERRELDPKLLVAIRQIPGPDWAF